MTDRAIQTQQQAEFTRDQIDLIKRTIARGASDDELRLFVMTAQRMGLDPFARQIHAVKRKQNIDGEWREIMAIQVGIDGYRLIAERTGRYVPGREPSFVYDKDGQLHAATAYVRKLVAGQWHEVAATAHIREYAQTKRDGNLTAMWASKPHIMLAKCAESLALRRAFPAELSGVYTDDEMGQADAAAGPTWTPAVVVSGDEPQAHAPAMTMEAEEERELTSLMQAEPKKNGNGQRPYPPEKVKDGVLGRSLKQHAGAQATNNQRGLVVGVLNLCFAGDPHADEKRHSVLKHLFRVTSMNDVSDPEVLALLDWLALAQDSGGAWAPSPMAAKEAGLIVREAIKAAGQAELPGGGETAQEREP